MVHPRCYKWIPVVEQDRCTGCGLCVDACDNGCLGMVWSYATLLGPDDCGSEGSCIPVCPDDAIHMEWVVLVGNPKTGQWRSA